VARLSVTFCPTRSSSPAADASSAIRALAAPMSWLTSATRPSSCWRSTKDPRAHTGPAAGSADTHTDRNRQPAQIGSGLPKQGKVSWHSSVSILRRLLLVRTVRPHRFTAKTDKNAEIGCLRSPACCPLQRPCYVVPLLSDRHGAFSPHQTPGAG
jgi:hypothetical protein